MTLLGGLGNCVLKLGVSYLLGDDSNSGLPEPGLEEARINDHSAEPDCRSPNILEWSPTQKLKPFAQLKLPPSTVHHDYESANQAIQISNRQLQAFNKESQLCLWKKSCYDDEEVDNGEVGCKLLKAKGRSATRGTVWGKIIRLKDDLLDLGIDIDDILFQSATGGEQQAIRWHWGLDSQLEFTTRSMRKAIDERILTERMMPNWSSGLVPCKATQFQLELLMLTEIPTITPESLSLSREFFAPDQVPHFLELGSS
ncbi:hypothetical protein LXL04_032223 [Taraxacum kok-saghyz]